MYLNDYVPNEVIRDDIFDILEERSNSAYVDWNKTEELTEMLESK
jgi:predicted house-cleaning noncanonical NTP pyrophosphatase (MazG superfamily)